MKPVVRHSGFSLIEVLVAIVVFAFGILAIAGLQLRTSVSEAEALQRAQAMVLVADMVERINLNRKAAKDYATVATSTIKTAPSDVLSDCAALAGAALDICQWTNLLQGAAITDGVRVGAMLGTVGCVRQLMIPAPGGGPAVPVERSYVVSVAWQGLQSTAAPDDTCGQGVITDETRRRVYSVVIQIADLAAT